MQNPQLNHLVELSFQRINRLFVLLFENDAQRIGSKRLQCDDRQKKLF